MINYNKIDVKKILQNFSETLPKFPDDRINYSNSPKALVLVCFVKYKDEILLLKRSDKVSTYQKMWNTVAGYMDEIISTEEKALTELREEIGISENMIASIKVGESYELQDEKIGRTWFTIPCLAQLCRKPEIKLDWEHTEYRWIKPEEITAYDTVPHCREAYESFLKP